VSWVDADATDLLALRDAMNARQRDVHVTPLALILRACVAGLREFRELNSRWDDEAREIELIGPVHLGFAAQTDRGLLVPVIKNAHTMSTLELAAELERLASAARFGTLGPADLTGGTFTVSNYGSFGVDGGPAIINFPEAAILGVGRIVDRPWVYERQIAVRKVTQLSVSFDHRICDGAAAGGFLRFVADCVESPATLLGAL
jgi:pyruvate dehydrogenase E2 component (dihydrolipoamide acetyltransferase)